MKYVGCVLLILAGSALAWASSNAGPYQPAVPQGNTVVAGGGWGGYGGNYGGSPPPVRP